MMRRLSAWLYRVSTGWIALIGLIVFVAFIALVLPRQSAEAQRYTRDAGSPDGSFFYTAADLYRMAEAYGQAGREAYVRARYTFDVAWPLAYVLFLATALSWVFGKAFATASRWRLANLAPILGMIFDYLENLAASLVILRYPAQTPIVDLLASVFTMIKWTFVNGSFVLLLIGVVVGIARYFIRSK